MAPERMNPTPLPAAGAGRGPALRGAPHPGRWRALGLALLAGCLSACTSVTPPPGVVPVSPFDLQRYEGRWYELARLDHAFERGMSDVSALYQAQPDGSVRVLNRGFDPARGQWREAVGKAWFTGSPRTGSLKVSFFGPFYGGYQVAALDPQYRWSLVIGPDTSYCWILSRSRTLDAAEREAIVARARALGVDTDALVWVSQQRQDPTH